jgi:hypothetical protein
MKMAVWYINLLPSSILSMQTSLELAFGLKPELSLMFPFYCPGVYCYQMMHSMSFGKLCRLVGYEDELLNDEKMFIIQDIMSHSIIRCINVKVDEKLCSTYCLDTYDF